VRRKLSVNHCAKNMNITDVSVETTISSRRKSATTSASEGSAAWASGVAGGRWRPEKLRSVRLRQLV